MVSTRPLPISTRHAFALAFDLAIRRDFLHSIFVPFLLRAPWVLSWALLTQGAGVVSMAALPWRSLALIGDFITLLIVGAMLRIRARSVFNTPKETHPMAAAECYGSGLRRNPWLLVTEVIRNTAFTLATSFSIAPSVLIHFYGGGFRDDIVRNLLLAFLGFLLFLPALFLGFRLAVATEAVVLDDHDMAGAFQHSFALMRGRFERWLELMAASGLIVIGIALLVAVTSLAWPDLSETWLTVLFWMLVVAATPVIQYAWTFFYLRLTESESSQAESRRLSPALPDPAADPAG